MPTVESVSAPRPRIDRTQVIAAGAWIVFSVAVLFFSGHLAAFNRAGNPGPGFFLKGVGFVLLALAIVRLLTILGLGFARPAPESATEGEEPIRLVNAAKVLAMGVALTAYAALMPTVGFLVATALLCTITLILVGRPPVRSLLEAVIAAIIIRYAFERGLGVPLPDAQLAFLAALGL